MARLSAYSYKLPCTHRGRQIFKEGLREGLFICEERDGEMLCAGEFAPLLGIHGETVERLVTCLKDSKEFGYLPKPLGYAVSMAHYHAGIKAKAHIKDSDQALRLSGLVESSEINEAVRLAQDLIARGFTCLKIKVGRLPIKDEIKKIKTIASLLGPKTKLRIDGNKRFTMSDALSLMDGLRRVRIDYFEEPLADEKKLADFHRQTGVPVALDESFGSLSDLEFYKPQVLVLKPSRFNSVYDVMKIAQAAERASVRIVLSHCFESDFSAACYAVMAWELGLLDRAHGILADGIFRHGLFTEPLRDFRGTLKISDCLSSLTNKFSCSLLSKIA